MASRWYVYLLRCADGTLYCGITNDLDARLAAHAAGKGAKYTRGRAPLELVATRACATKGFALRLEHAVKQLPRDQKLALDRAGFEALVRRLRRAASRSPSPARAARRPARREAPAPSPTAR